jgi:hypothetical protein
MLEEYTALLLGYHSGSLLVCRHSSLHVHLGMDYTLVNS